jgi:hypothetical protein
MKGIELAVTDTGCLEIRCLQHDIIHTGSQPFCCTDVMIRAMCMSISKSPEGYRARMSGPAKPTGLSSMLYEIATAPLLLDLPISTAPLLFNSPQGGVLPID